MKMLKKVFCSIAAIAFLSSCTYIVPVTVSDAPIGSKKGVSKTGVLLNAIELNTNYGVAEAAKNGKITGPVSTVDEKTTLHPFSFLFYNKELIITGE